MSAEATDAFAVRCECGETLRGPRQRRHQVLPCPRCSRRVFVLPQDPWAAPAVRATPAVPLPRRLVRAAVAAGTVAVLSLAILYFGLRPFLVRPPAAGLARETTAADAGTEIRRRLQEGQQALAGGNFRHARMLLQEARGLLKQHPQALPPAEEPRLEQLGRAADLLADLLRVSLEEILRQAQQLRDEREWQEQFVDYRGRSVLFDDMVRPDPRGRPSLAIYRVAVDGVTARLALEDLTLWQRLPVDGSWRTLFGARLAGCGRETGGGWVFHFQPESGVLLTDPGAAAACCPVPLGAEVEEVLRRQARWLQR